LRYSEGVRERIIGTNTDTQDEERTKRSVTDDLHFFLDDVSRRIIAARQLKASRLRNKKRV
jgi:hypothetical protein